MLLSVACRLPNVAGPLLAFCLAAEGVLFSAMLESRGKSERISLQEIAGKAIEGMAREADDSFGSGEHQPRGIFERDGIVTAIFAWCSTGHRFVVP